MQRRQLLTHTHALGQFTRRMALVDLTGSVASWAKEVHDGLSEAGHVEVAAVFALSPPFAAADPTTGDYDRLEQHVAARMQVLEDLLSADAALGA
jgi:hypothetical protein